MSSRPLTYLDNNNTFNEPQIKKINSMIRTQYHKFLDKTFQEQEGPELGHTAITSQSGRVLNATSYEYNGTGFAAFQLVLLGMETDEDVPILTTENEIKEIESWGGSSYAEMYDDLSEYGYFKFSGNTLYFHMTADPETLLFPYCNVTWRY